MKDFFLILFFSKTILLTQNPITMSNGELELKLNEPIEAITSGASIQIDVTSMLKWDKNEGIKELRKKLDAIFPSGSIKAKLIEDDGMEIDLIYTGSSLINEDNVRLSLYGDGKISVDKEFTSIKLISSVELDEVNVYWKNYKK